MELYTRVGEEILCQVCDNTKNMTPFGKDRDIKKKDKLKTI